MSDTKNEVRLGRLSKEDEIILKEKNRIKKEELKATSKIVSGKSKLSAEDRSKIKKLNILQFLFIGCAILIEVLNIYNIIPQLVSIIGLVILTSSCIYTFRKINKIMKMN